MAKLGKSNSQNKLASLISEALPFYRIDQEVSISKLIELQGYTTEEVRRQLKRPYLNKLICDIIIYSDPICVVEFDGSQHFTETGASYSQNRADTLKTQELDEQKDLILSLVGIPIIRIRENTYYDTEILAKKIQESRDDLLEYRSKEMDECQKCHRLFLLDYLEDGCCKSCLDERDEHIRTSHKERQRQYRREQYQKFKQSDCYKEQKQRKKQAERKWREQKKQQQKELYSSKRD